MDNEQEKQQAEIVTQLAQMGYDPDAALALAQDITSGKPVFNPITGQNVGTPIIDNTQVNPPAPPTTVVVPKITTITPYVNEVPYNTYFIRMGQDKDGNLIAVKADDWNNATDDAKRVILNRVGIDTSNKVTYADQNVSLNQTEESYIKQNHPDVYNSIQTEGLHAAWSKYADIISNDKLESSLTPEQLTIYKDAGGGQKGIDAVNIRITANRVNNQEIVDMAQVQESANNALSVSLLQRDSLNKLSKYTEDGINYNLQSAINDGVDTKILYDAGFTEAQVYQTLADIQNNFTRKQQLQYDMGALKDYAVMKDIPTITTLDSKDKPLQQIVGYNIENYLRNGGDISTLQRLGFSQSDIDNAQNKIKVRPVYEDWLQNYYAQVNPPQKSDWITPPDRYSLLSTTSDAIKYRNDAVAQYNKEYGSASWAKSTGATVVDIAGFPAYGKMMEPSKPNITVGDWITTGINTAMALYSLKGIPAVDNVIPKIGWLQKVVVPTETGDVQVWRGIDINGNPMIGMSDKKLVLGTSGIEYPPADTIQLVSDIKSGYKPITALETKVMANPSAMAKMGYSAEEIAKVQETLGSMDSIYGLKSPYIEPETPTKIKSLSQDGVKTVLQQVVDNPDIVSQVYGSGTIKVQVAPELKGWREPADIDIQLKVGEENGIEFARKLADKLKTIEGVDNVRVGFDEAHPTLIETKDATGWHHAVDIHVQGESELGVSSTVDRAAGYGYVGKKLTQPSVIIDYPNIGQVKVMSLSESGIRKGVAILRWHPTDTYITALREQGIAEEQIAKLITTGDVTIAPSPERLKDITDFYVILRTFEGEDAANAWATSYGYDYTQIKTLAELNPTSVKTWEFEPSPNATGIEPQVGVSPSISFMEPSSIVSAPLVDELANQIKTSYSVLYPNDIKLSPSIIPKTSSEVSANINTPSETLDIASRVNFPSVTIVSPEEARSFTVTNNIIKEISIPVNYVADKNYSSFGVESTPVSPVIKTSGAISTEITPSNTITPSPSTVSPPTASPPVSFISPSISPPIIATPLPPIPTSKNPKRIIVPLEFESDPKKTDKLKSGFITWRQGKTHWAIPQLENGSFDSNDKVSSGKPFRGTTKYATGKGSVYKTFEYVGQNPPDKSFIDIGWAQFDVKNVNGQLQITRINPDDTANWEGVNKYTTPEAVAKKQLETRQQHEQRQLAEIERYKKQYMKVRKPKVKERNVYAEVDKLLAERNIQPEVIKSKDGTYFGYEILPPQVGGKL